MRERETDMPKTKPLTLPSGLEEFNDEYSNFDHVMPDGAEEVLRTGKVSMTHPGWDHYGTIWYADGQFHEAVMRYRAHVATISADTLQGVINGVNEKYGHA